MTAPRFLVPLLVFATLAVAASTRVPAAEMSLEDAWKGLPKYEYGQDMAPLLAIDREVIAAMASAQTRGACAARLADLLGKDETTPAARQYICLQLRQVGTAAEVPLLERLLAKAETSEMARAALESIPGPEAGAALRGGLASLRGQALVGVIHSLGARKDPLAVASLVKLADANDAQVAKAAIAALGNIADEQSTDFLVKRAEAAGMPAPPELAVALLRCARAGRQAKAIYTKLSRPEQTAATRRAALEGLLRLEGANAEKTVLTWFSSEDADRRRIAASRLQGLSNEQLDKLLAGLSDLSDAGRIAVVELAVTRRGASMLPTVISLLRSSNPDQQVAAVRCLGMIGDVSSIPVLLEMLPSGGGRTAAAQEALARLPRKPVTEALLGCLRSRPALRVPVIGVLVELKCYDAIDPLVEIAAHPDPVEYEPALNGLRGIADPDKTDIPRLVKLLLASQPGKHRDEVEKTILVVCDKLPPEADRSELVIASLAGVDASKAPDYLPLLGRLGGARSLEMIEASINSTDAAVQEAAVRALCNWPNADVADRLLQLAKQSQNRAHGRWALRAYIRVVSLRSERPEAETLSLLKNAFALADGVDEKRLAIERASTVRTMEAVTWIAQFLDDPELAQAACNAIVELAHHRFLRHPNMEPFGPILDKVGRTSKDPAVVERAKRYRLGL